MSRFLLCLMAALFAGATPGVAHEFWIEPEKFQLQNSEDLVVHLRNGQEFKGSTLAYFPSQIDRFEIWRAGKALPVSGRMGDIPALAQRANGAGLMTLIHQTAPATLTYKTWEKFQTFADHKDFPDLRARHMSRGLPETGFSETYLRFAKALVAVGTGEGRDVDTGMETEFVALANPYTDDLSKGMPVRLLYLGAPRADAQVEMFARAPGGTVEITLHRTDSDGVVILPVRAGHTYLLDAVVLRPAPAAGKPVWETLWAGLCFALPDGGS